MKASSLRDWWTRDALIVAVPLLALVVGTFYLASRYVQPAPPDTLVMATGTPGGLITRMPSSTAITCPGSE